MFLREGNRKEVTLNLRQVIVTIQEEEIIRQSRFRVDHYTLRPNWNFTKRLQSLHSDRNCWGIVSRDSRGVEQDAFFETKGNVERWETENYFSKHSFMPTRVHELMINKLTDANYHVEGSVLVYGFTREQGVTNRYFRYSINTDKNRLFSILIKWLLSHIENR